MDAHILRRHLKLILAKRVETTQGDVWMSDTVLSGGEQLEIISRLQNCAIVRRDVQTEHDGPSRAPSADSLRIKTTKRLTTTRRRSSLQQNSQGWWKSCGPRSCGRESSP